MTRFSEIIKELQAIVKSENKTLTLKFDPGWTQPDVFVAGEFVSAFPIKDPNSIQDYFQERKEKK
jgi:hypothetical protein